MTKKMKWAIALSVAALLICFVGIANAQTVAKPVRITWKLPTAYDDGSALAAADITKVQAYIGVGPIADNATVAPTVEVGPTAQPLLRTVTVPAGGTVYVRLRACVGTNCSVLSPQVTLAVPTPKPGPPTDLTIELVIT